LEDRGCALEVVKPIYYWITARSEPLMYDFVVEKLSDVRRRLAPAVGVADAESWIRDKLTECGKVWSRSVTTKVAQGLLAALRDFGVLEGSVKKRLVPYYFPLESFAYLAFVLCRLGEAGGGCITHSDWRLFFLSLPAVERLFMEAHQQRLLEYYAAGSIIRVTFPTESLEEYSRVVTRRPY